MSTTALLPRFTYFLSIAVLLVVGTATVLAEAAPPCEIVFADGEPVARELGLHAGVYRCAAPIVAARPGRVPVAAASLDVAGDGDADLVVRFAGEADDLDLLVPRVGSRLGAPRPFADSAAIDAVLAGDGAAAGKPAPPAPILLVTRIDHDAHPELVVALDDGAVAIASIVLATVVVDSTSETVDFTGAQQIGDLPGPDGLITLREAIVAANNTAGADLVQFNIPTAGNDCHDGACWFTPSDGEAGAYPTIAGAAITFDGYSQTTNRGDTNPGGPELMLDGAGLTSGSGLVFQSAPNSAVVDFGIVQFPGAGLLALASNGFAVRGCQIGTAVDGASAAPNLRGIDLSAGTQGATIGGGGTHGTVPLVPDRNLVSGNTAAGISLNGDDTDGNSILGNRIGTNRAGGGAIPNADGVAIDSGASANEVGGVGVGEGNLISGNGVTGVTIAGGSSAGNRLRANTIGAALGGLAALANGTGVLVHAGAPGTIVGGTTAPERNLISGNSGEGVHVTGTGTTGTTILGNWIGTDATGAAALGNGGGGVLLNTDSSAAIVGGASAGAGNVVSGNGGEAAVHLNGSSDNDVLGNRVGTNAAGTAALANTNGIFVVGGAGNDVGDGTAGGRNLVSGNSGFGITLGGTAGSRVRGNWIGLDAAGTAAIGNGAQGVLVQQASTDCWVGGPTAGEGNTIVASNGFAIFVTDAGTTGTLVRGNVLGRAPSLTGAQFANTVGIGNGNGATDSVVGGPGAAANEVTNSTQDGVRVATAGSLRHRITRNSIHGNGWLGIALDFDGVTPNDPGDGDTGPNALVNWPVLSSAVNVCGAGTTSVSGTLDSPSPSPDLGVVELFSSSAADPSGNGEGETFAGQTAPAFNGAIQTVVPLQPTGRFLTATYTDDDDNTSEFSNAIPIVATPFAPTTLDAELVAGPQIALDWNDSATDETGFRIERRAAGGAFGLLANVGANLESFTDPGPFTAGATYFYRVRAESTAGGGCQSAWSNVVSAMIPPATTAFCRRTATHHFAAANPNVEAASPGVFGLVFRETDDDRAKLYYARLDATGAIVGSPAVVRDSASQAIGGALAWAGNRWGMVWFERLHDEFGLFFQTIGLDGDLLTGPIAVAEAAAVPTVNQLLAPGFAWDGQGWGIVWPDIRNGFTEVRYAHIAADGVTKGTADILVNDNGSFAFGPRLAWNGTHHLVAWFDSRTSTSQIYTRRLARDGTPAGASVAATTGAVTANVSFVDLVWDGGSEVGMTWLDRRDGRGAAYFRRLALDGTPLSPETRLADPDPTADQAQLALRRAASHWVVAAEDFRAPEFNEEIRLSFADLAGAKLGGDVVVSTPLADDQADDPAIAWDGSRLLVAWHESVAADSLEIVAQVVDEDGDPGANPRRHLTSGHAPGINAAIGAATLELVPSGFVAVWEDLRSNLGSDPLLRRVDGAGLPFGAEIAVADLPVASFGSHLASSWSGETLAVGWVDVSSGDSPVALSRFDGAGVKLGPDVLLPMNATLSGLFDVHWTGERFLVAFEKTGAPNAQEIYVAAYLPDGTLDSGPHRISVAGGRSMQPSLAGGSGAPIVVWRDTRDGNGEIYAAALDATGARVGSEIRLTNDAADSSRPAVSWNGDQFGVAWEDSRTGQSEIRFRRLAADATAVGGEIQLSGNFGRRAAIASDGAGWAVAYGGFGDDGTFDLGGLFLAKVDAAGVEIGDERLALQSANVNAQQSVIWDGSRWVVAMIDRLYVAGELALKSSACAFDTTPPACPTGLSATVSGRDVTLTWNAAVDVDFAVERQYVVRDGLELAALVPDASGWIDAEVSPGAYLYSVGAMNGGYLDAASCPSLAVNVPLFTDGFESGDTTAWSATTP